MNQSNLSADERIRKISDLLKTADRYVLAGDFDKANEQVNQVFNIDPDNIYAKAYLKRIDVFKKKQRGDATEDIAPPEPDIHVEEVQAVNKSPDDEGEKEKIDEHSLVVRQQTIDKAAFEEQRKIVEEIIAKEADHLDPAADDPVSQYQAMDIQKDPEILKQEENESRYRKALEALWKSGSITDDDRKKLQQLQSTLGVSDERHEEIERSVKLSAYVSAVKESWRDGLITPNSAAALDSLREQYNISIDEHLMIESRIMYELHGIRVKGVVMIIDDDIELVKIIKSILREEGYAPFSAHTPEHGLRILERTLPDLILLDVTFPKPSISGFTTYEQIRKRPKLRFIPVVFLSGLDEEHIVQVGKKLGADDYITKPCSEQMLVSTIEGKIKRYKEMRKMLEAK